MTEKEKKTIQDFINGEKTLYIKIEEIYNKYKDKNIKYSAYMDFLKMYMSDKLPNLNNYIKAKKAIRKDI